MGRKSQVALEFLTKFAWAFLVILIALGALYYFGVFDFSKFLPQRCLFPSQFECIDYSFIGDEVRLRLVNSIGEDIIVDSFEITNDAVEPLTCNQPAPFGTWQNGAEVDIVFSGCQNGAFIVGERSEADITLTFYSPNTPSQPRHNLNGKITAIVNKP